MMTATLLAATLARTPADVEKRIDRVVNGLLSETAFRRVFGTPAKLRDRMAHFRGPKLELQQEGRRRSPRRWSAEARAISLPGGHV